MAGSLNDFLNLFGGEQEAHGGRTPVVGILEKAPDMAHYVDRFASNDPQDAQFENSQLYQGAADFLGQMSDEQFLGAAINAFNRADDVQRQGLAGGLLGALRGRGLDLGVAASMLGLNSTDPRRMGADDYARWANFARTQHPAVMQDVVRQQPWFLKALGNPVVASVLGTVAARMLNGRPQGLQDTPR